MTSPYDPDAEWDGDSGDAGDPGEDLAAALDFSAPRADDVDVDDMYVGDAEPEEPAEGYIDPYEQQEEPEDLGQLFSVSNPPGTLTVTAFLDGGIQSVEISPSVTGMAESELARELLAIAKVAAIKARAGQYELLMKTTPQEAGEREFLGEFLHHGVGLPTPAQAARAEAEFVQRYLSEDL